MRALSRGSEHETTFLWPEPHGTSSESSCAVRWFSGRRETQLCGTGALAATCCVTSGAPADSCLSSQVRLHAPQATLVGRREGARRVAVRLPRFDWNLYEPAPALLRALRLRGATVAAVASETTQTVLLHLPDARAVEALKPNGEALRALRHPELGAVIAAAPGAKRFDVAYRYFTPWHGKDESRVAGSALALLAPYWSTHSRKRALRCHQRSPLGASFNAHVRSGGVWIAANAVCCRTAAV